MEVERTVKMGEIQIGQHHVTCVRARVRVRINNVELTLLYCMNTDNIASLQLAHDCMTT